ncbi:hypothetical protein ACOME3_002068 [Neoechinorhynchus agilis]
MLDSDDGSIIEELRADSFLHEEQMRKLSARLRNSGDFTSIQLLPDSVFDGGSLAVDRNKKGRSIDRNKKGRSIDRNKKGRSIDRNKKGRSIDGNRKRRQRSRSTAKVDTPWSQRLRPRRSRSMGYRYRLLVMNPGTALECEVFERCEDGDIELFRLERDNIKRYAVSSSTNFRRFKIPKDVKCNTGEGSYDGMTFYRQEMPPGVTMRRRYQCYSSRAGSYNTILICKPVFLMIDSIMIPKPVTGFVIIPKTSNVEICPSKGAKKH